MKTENNINIMDDDIFRGVFDSDGMVLLNIANYAARLDTEGKTLSPDSQPFGVQIVYGFEQSGSKTDLVQQVSRKFGINVDSVIEVDADNTTRSVFRANVNSDAGQKLRELLLNHKPLHPDRLYDFLLSEEVLKLIQVNAQKTRQGLVTLIYLAYHNTRNLTNRARKEPIEYWLSFIKPNTAELNQGMAEGQRIVTDIKNQVAVFEQHLSQMTLPLDYIRGLHFGDGGLTIALSWKDKEKGDRRRCEPEWSISCANKALCQALVNTLGGRINETTPGYFTYRLNGIQKTLDAFFVFEDTWMPAYKRKQFERFKKAVLLLAGKRHFTKTGTVELIELAYDMSEKGFRTMSKQQYIDNGLKWLENNGYDVP